MLLPELHRLGGPDRSRLYEDWDRPLPADPTAYVLERYGLDIRGRYGGRVIRNPFGKASGQLSLHIKQVEADAAAGLGFCVLKTAIAQDETGHQMMKEWAIKETRMVVEPIAGKRAGRLGWTVTWKGRGWHESFDSYLTFTREAVSLGRAQGMVVAPSIKYHLPGPGETEWRTDEYHYTTRALAGAWKAGGEAGPMILEKDFSPTLSGDGRSSEKARILEWLQTVPGLIRGALSGDGVTLGMKVMNARFEEEFQLEMLKMAAQGADFIIGFNRLFDPAKEFEGKVGVAYGGPDLSERNLAVLRRAREAGMKLPSISGTGDVSSGRIALEYALLGAESLQMHTLFQLPDLYYGCRSGSKSARALHHLLFHPSEGLLPWMLFVKERTGIDSFLGLQHAEWEALAR